MIEGQYRRNVDQNVVVSSGMPEISIHVDEAYTYAGNQQFVLEDIAHVDQFLFVAIDDHWTAQRLLMVHFVIYPVGSQPPARPEPMQAIKLGGAEYGTEALVDNVAIYQRQHPASDVNKAFSYLANQGYRIEGDYQEQRFLRLLEEERFGEFLILYFEFNVPADQRLSGVELADPESEASHRLLKRALDSFTIVEG